MRALVDQVKQSAKLRWNRVHDFRPKIKLEVEFGPYILKIADSYEELIESFKLRHEVFHVEFQDSSPGGLDFDKFDRWFDHLIIIHKDSQKIIGTYRLNCTDSLRNSYTALEFDLTSIFDMQGPFLELGRACIQKDHRKGAVISLLWRGIAEYMNLTQAQILFGCSSIKVNNARNAALIYRYLINSGGVTEDALAKPTEDFRMKDFSEWIVYFKNQLTEPQKVEAEAMIPSLLKSYLKLGAKVAGEPAFDRDFDCIDLLTVLKKQDLSQALAKKFAVKETSQTDLR